MKTRYFVYVVLATLGYPLMAQGFNARGMQPSDRDSSSFEYRLSSHQGDAYVDPSLGYGTCCDDCCDACDAAPCCGSHRERWWSKWRSCNVYGSVDALFWHRTNDSFKQPFVVNANNGEQIYSTSDLDFQYEPGIRATIGLGHAGICCLPAFEITYLGIYDWDERVGATGDNLLSLAGDLGSVVNGFTLAEGIGTEYGSKLNSLETNYFGCILETCCCDCYRRLEWLAGFRYLSLDEDLTTLGYNENVANAVYRIDTNNDLYGGQLGSRYRAFKGCWGFEAVGKAGIYGNDSDQQQFIVDELGVNDVVLRSASASGGYTTFVGELGLSGIAKLTRRCSLRCGYNVMWIEGVALAPNQLDFTDTNTSGTALRRNDGTFIHGFNFGLECGY